MTRPLPYRQDVNRLLARGSYGEARQLCLQWLNRQPDNANAWYLKAFAEINNYQSDSALTSIDRSLMLKPGNIKVLALKAHILGATGHSQQCLEIVDKLLAGPDLPSVVLYQIGSTLNDIGAHQRALELFERVQQLEPDRAANLNNLGTTYLFLGRYQEAASAQMAAIELEPDNFRTYGLLAQIQKATPENNYTELFHETLAKHAGAIEARISLNFALARQYEELSEFDRSFRHLQQGCAAVLEHTPYDIEADRKLHESVIHSFDEEFCRGAGDGCDSREPIFIVGMPRTGTTLLEQILTTYDDIETAGELKHFTHLLNRACKPQIPDADGTSLYRQAEQVDWRELGDSYLANARQHVGASPFFIDKYPLNYAMLGPILRALPNARIINLRRNAMDTCFSNYKLLYNPGTSLHSYDLVTMGEYFCRYREMMQHWHNCAPGRILDVEYEALVTRPEAITREVADFLDLPWDGRCLDFYKSGTAVATASVNQVRQPINTDSLYKWRKFESHLYPLIDLFKKRDISLD